MAQLTPEEAVRRAKKAWAAKAKWESTLGDAMRIVHPHRDGFHKYAPGQKKEGTTWDSTAGTAAIRGANRLMGLTPAFEDWIVLEPGPAAEMALSADDLNKLRTELQALSKQCNAMCQLGDFSAAVHEMWIDWLYSTGAMTVDGSTDPAAPLAVFRSAPLSEFMIEEGPDGNVDTWHRRFKIAGRAIKVHWPDAVIPTALQDKIGRKPEEEVELFEITYRDYDEQKNRYRYEVFYHKGATKHRLVERQERTSRWLTPRNVKVAGETLGRGQILQAMPDIRTLNTVVETTMRAAMLALLGIWTSSDPELNVNTIRMRPATVIKVRSNGGATGPSLQRLDDPNIRMDFADAMTTELRMSIKRALFDDALPSDAGPVRSATEIVQRMRALAVDLGGTYGRIINEFVQPLVQRLIDILQSRGIKTTDFEIDQFFVRVSVSSQVARAQSMGEVENIVQWLEIILTTGGKEALLVAAVVEDLYTHIGQAMGIPEKLIRPPKEQKQALAKMQKMAAEQVEAEAAGGVPQRGAAPEALAA